MNLWNDKIKETLDLLSSKIKAPDGTESIELTTKEAELIERVLEDCFSSRNKEEGPAGVGYVIARYKLWKGNLWKHRIVYTDSVISTFLAQIKSHLMKPATIIGN